MRIIIILYLAICSFRAYSQPSRTDLFLYNIGFNAGVSSLGALINKNKKEDFKTVLLKALGQGALGGYCIYQSKNSLIKLAKSNHRDYKQAWFSKLLHTTGSSITENAASNRNFWERWHINLGFNRFTIEKKKKKLHFYYQIMPVSLYSSIWSSFYGNLNVKKSIQYGVPYFIRPRDVRLSLDNPPAYAFSNSISIMDSEGEFAIAHELVHVYQFEEYALFNSYFDRLREKYATKNKYIKFYTKWVYTDVNYFGYSYLYLAGGYSTYEKHRNNFYEQEANFFGDITH